MAQARARRSLSQCSPDSEEGEEGPLRHVTSIIVGMVAGGLVGFGLQRLRWSSVVASSVAIIAGWLIGSFVAAAAWLMSPPIGVDVLAVSLGFAEMVMSGGVMVVLGLLLHLGIGAAAGVDSPLLAYRPALLGIAGALCGVLGFAIGAAVKPVT